MIKKHEAIERLTQAVNAASADDLTEIFNELFPEDPITEEVVIANIPAVVGKIDAHLANGLEVEEILDLWNVIFPAHREVWFDEYEDAIHYDGKNDHAGLAD